MAVLFGNDGARLDLTIAEPLRLIKRPKFLFGGVSGVEKALLARWADINSVLEWGTL